MILSPARVLLVDDEQQQLELSASILRMSGFAVLTASGPLHALSLVDSAEQFDAAIVDYEMPTMNGCDLADHLRTARPKMNIILYSAAVTIPQDDLNRVDTFIPKGEGIGVLVRHLSNLFSRKRTQVCAPVPARDAGPRVPQSSSAAATSN
jgi:two-component system, chemotaxis family, chemotaxis protein CheY